MKGYFGMGVYRPKCTENVGTLWRSAYLFNASFIFTIGRGYKKQPTDTIKATRNIPLFYYFDWEVITAYENPTKSKEIG